MIAPPRDTLILYGQAERLTEIGRRRAGLGGDRSHGEAMEAHRELVQEQDREELLRRQRQQQRQRASHEAPPDEAPQDDMHAPSRS